MKYKTQEVEEAPKDAMGKELYDKFVELMQLEYDKISTLESAKHYFANNGFIRYKKFVKEVMKNCKKFKWDLEDYLMINEMEIPDLTVKGFVKFDSPEDAFQAMREAEDDVFKKLMELASIAFEEKDACTFAFLLPLIKQGKRHIFCIAANSVANGEDPNDLLKCEQPSMEN